MKVKNLVNFAFQNSLIPLINKSDRVTRTNATVIDNILTNAFLNKQIETGIIITEISDHFPIFLITDPITSSEIENKRTLLCKRTINTATKENFKEILARKTWDYIKEIGNPDEAYCKFLYDFFSVYEEAFPEFEIRIKQKSLISLWITKGIMKSFKQKQKFLYFVFCTLDNCLATEIRSQNEKCFLTCIYRSPSQNHEEF